MHLVTEQYLAALELAKEELPNDDFQPWELKKENIRVFYDGNNDELSFVDNNTEISSFSFRDDSGTMIEDYIFEYMNEEIKELHNQSDKNYTMILNGKFQIDYCVECDAFQIQEYEYDQNKPVDYSKVISSWSNLTEDKIPTFLANRLDLEYITQSQLIAVIKRDMSLSLNSTERNQLVQVRDKIEKAKGTVEEFEKYKIEEIIY